MLGFSEFILRDQRVTRASYGCARNRTVERDTALARPVAIAGAIMPILTKSALPARVCRFSNEGATACNSSSAICLDCSVQFDFCRRLAADLNGRSNGRGTLIWSFPVLKTQIGWAS